MAAGTGGADALRLSTRVRTPGNPSSGRGSDSADPLRTREANHIRHHQPQELTVRENGAGPHDPGNPGLMSPTLDALADAWFDECWAFHIACPNWYYLGITSLPDWFGLAQSMSIGIRRRPRGIAAISGFHDWTIAHEVGHLFLLKHAPCSVIPSGTDEYYPHSGGRIGATPGYKFPGRSPFVPWQLVPSSKTDYMSYCRDFHNPPEVWVSDYHFTKVHRNLTALSQMAPEGHGPVVAGQAGRVLRISGGRYGGMLRLEPSFVVQGRPLLPSSPGPYELIGVDAGGNAAFRYRFDMDSYWDSPTEDGSFHFAIPVVHAWSHSLERIVLRGPEGSTEMGRDTEELKTWVFDARDNLLRAVLRGRDSLAGLRDSSEFGDYGDSLVAITSRGIPDETAWAMDWRAGEPTTSASQARRSTVLVRRRW